MATMEITKYTNSPEGISHAALTMAIGIVMERIQKLPQEDRNDLYELLKELVTAQTCDERESIGVTMLEILDQRPVQVQPMNLAEDPPGPGLQKWIDYVSGRIRTLRRAANLTQDELAEKAGLPQSHISRLESAKHSPSRATLEKIAAALGVPLGELDPSA